MTSISDIGKAALKRIRDQPYKVPEFSKGTASDVATDTIVFERAENKLL